MSQPPAVSVTREVVAVAVTPGSVAVRVGAGAVGVTVLRAAPPADVLLTVAPEAVAVSAGGPQLLVRALAPAVTVVEAGTQGLPGVAGPPGPPGPPGAGGAAALYSAENRDTVPFPRGCPLAVHPSGVGVVRAGAAAGLNRPCVGLASAGVAPGFAEAVQTSGPLSLPDWSAVTGAVTLMALAAYFLDTATGRLAVSPPTAAGDVLQYVGQAVAPDTLDLDPDPRGILL